MIKNSFSSVKILSMHHFRFNRININVLFFKNRPDGNPEKCQVAKTDDRNDIRVVNTYDICQFALNWWNNPAAKNHHDQECGTLCGVFPQASNRKAEDRWP